MTARLLRLVIAIFLGCRCVHAELAVAPSIGRVEVKAELPNEPPYVGEPILLRVRWSIRANVMLDKLIQPTMTNFDWQQFGIDASTNEIVDGFPTPVFERVLMVTPLKTGSLTIPPFVLRATIVTANNERSEMDFSSRPLVVEVRSHEGVGKAGDRWLPAKSVKIADNWETAPDKIPFGETARRTVTIEAVGATADRLPPPPDIRAEGIIVFEGPVGRQTIVTDEGPIARAVYQWSVRPVSATPASVPAIHIAWFDVAARKMRDAAAPEREVSFLQAARKARQPLTKTPGLLSARPLAAGAASFAWTLALAYLIASSKPRRVGWRGFIEPTPKAIRQLRSAARRNDARAFRRAVADLSRVDRDRWRRVSVESGVESGLASVDAALFGANAATAPSLPSLAHAIATAWRKKAR
ncbi:MAG: hypothetical protein ACLPSF_09505 [Methylocella sp.]